VKFRQGNAIWRETQLASTFSEEIGSLLKLVGISKKGCNSMAQDNSFASEPRMWLRYHFQVKRWWLYAGAVLIALAVVGSMSSAVVTGETAKHGRVSGAGKTIIEGGTGGTAPLPVTTLVAFHADAQGGDFECLAFTPSEVTGAGSGEFNVNVMYVTGKVTSLEIGNGLATMRGTATVTGLGAGQGLPFTASVHAGGPGTTVKLDVSGLAFAEILVDGHISMD
jgi:hypothetical protein